MTSSVTVLRRALLDPAATVRLAAAHALGGMAELAVAVGVVQLRGDAEDIAAEGGRSAWHGLARFDGHRRVDGVIDGGKVVPAAAGGGRIARQPQGRARVNIRLDRVCSVLVDIYRR